MSSQSHRKSYRLRGESYAAFPELDTRRSVILDLLKHATPYNDNTLVSAVDQFFNTLGLPNLYFDTNSNSSIVKHIASLIAAKELARSSGKPLDIELRVEEPTSAFFAARSVIYLGDSTKPDSRHSYLSPANYLERYLDAQYLGGGENTRKGDSEMPPFLRENSPVSTTVDSSPGGMASISSNGPDPLSPLSQVRCWRLQCYRTKGIISGAHLRLYFLQKPDFVEPNPAPHETDITKLADKNFLVRTPPELIEQYARVVREASERMGPAIHVQKITLNESDDFITSSSGDSSVNSSTEEKLTQSLSSAHDEEGVLLMVGHRVGTTHSFFSSMPNIYRFLGMYAAAKYVEVFANGIVVYSFRLRGFDASALSNLGPSAFTVGTTPALRAMFTPATPVFPFDLSSSHNHLHQMSNLSLDTMASSAPSSATKAPVGGNPSQAPVHSSNINWDKPEVDATINSMRAKRIAKMSGPNAPSLKERARDLRRDASLLFVLPRTSLSPLLNQGLLSAQEVAYAYCAWKFCYHFLPRMAAEASSLASLIKSVPAQTDEKAQALSLLAKLRKALQSQSFTESAILDVISQHPDVVSWCFDDFCRFHKPRLHSSGRSYTPNPISATAEAANGGGGIFHKSSEKAFSGVNDVDLGLELELDLELDKEDLQDAYTPMQQPLGMDEALAVIRKMLKGTEEEMLIFQWFLTFNRVTLKTNFFKGLKTALSFRFEPSFLSADFPEKPYGIFMIIGAEMRGFHVRFRDIARGGLRLIKSSSPQAFTANVSTLFEECYSLALTQNRKNKDITEGGSKGTLILSPSHQDKASVAFYKYVDSLLDLMLPSPEIVDLVRKPEILFFGPDENTAGFMDKAATLARSRGYEYWKSLTTGKSPSFGGIPHDEFGMTSRGVRTYELGVQEQLGLGRFDAAAAAQGRPGRLTKFQIGGPDGDLGSNEILLSAGETHVGIVDGSGVLVDPEGLDRTELVRLARARKMAKFFDPSKLSKQGYFVGVDDTDVTLPDGSVVASGLQFRNNAHFLRNVTADFFVPCGGRPAAVTLDKVDSFLYGIPVSAAGGAAVTLASSSGPTTDSASHPTSQGPISPLQAVFGANAAKAHAHATAASNSTNANTTASRTPRFKYIVEGANLFFTNDARVAIEQRGVLVFKDASANKGGVTSSSLEVLASLALKDDEFSANMCTQRSDASHTHAFDPESDPSLADPPLCNPDAVYNPLTPDEPGKPAFYCAYVRDVEAFIERNARLEFTALVREFAKERLRRNGNGDVTITELADKLSIRIDTLSHAVLEHHGLWNDARLRGKVLQRSLPPSLIQFVGGLDVLIGRLPPNYVKALFSSTLASSFVYEYGIHSDDFAFAEFIEKMKA